MDVQRGIVDRFTEDPAYIRRLRRAVDAAHTAGIPVIYVVIGFRPGHPEISPRNKTFAQLAKSARGTAGGFTEGDPGADVHPDVAPGPHDLIVTKKRVSAFTGSGLETVLRAADIDSLVLTGMATSGVVGGDDRRRRVSGAGEPAGARGGIDHRRRGRWSTEGCPVPARPGRAGTRSWAGGRSRWARARTVVRIWPMTSMTETLTPTGWPNRSSIRK
ncbi:cysteine hydrolase family protein [Streptomyces sp. NBC_00996]|uniref:cysteine hydrolase family protein n=1 Tax=Streptomyces sp. NBC_00996 TaxID=2903710 RepID=UPI00386CC2A9